MSKTSFNWKNKNQTFLPVKQWRLMEEDTVLWNIQGPNKAENME